MKNIPLIILILFILSCEQKGIFETTYHIKVSNEIDFNNICALPTLYKTFDSGNGSVSVSREKSFINKEKSSYIASVDISYSGKMDGAEEKVDTLNVVLENAVQELFGINGYQIKKNINDFAP